VLALGLAFALREVPLRTTNRVDDPDAIPSEAFAVDPL